MTEFIHILCTYARAPDALNVGIHKPPRLREVMPTGICAVASYPILASVDRSLSM